MAQVPEHISRIFLKLTTWKLSGILNAIIMENSIEQTLVPIYYLNSFEFDSVK